jgi:hypothetical protein
VLIHHPIYGETPFFHTHPISSVSFEERTLPQSDGGRGDGHPRLRLMRRGHGYRHGIGGRIRACRRGKAFRRRSREGDLQANSHAGASPWMNHACFSSLRPAYVGLGSRQICRFIGRGSPQICGLLKSLILRIFDPPLPTRRTQNLFHALPVQPVFYPALPEDLMVAKQSTHVRMPERSEAISGTEQIPGEPPKTPPVADPRTASQDPAIKPKGLTP